MAGGDVNAQSGSVLHLRFSHQYTARQHSIELFPEAIFVIPCIEKKKTACDSSFFYWKKKGCVCMLTEKGNCTWRSREGFRATDHVQQGARHFEGAGVGIQEKEKLSKSRKIKSNTNFFKKPHGQERNLRDCEPCCSLVAPLGVSRVPQPSSQRAAEKFMNELRVMMMSPRTTNQARTNHQVQAGNQDSAQEI